MEKINENLKVIAITWHKPDNWYGTNHRVMLMKDTNVSFDNAKEAKQYRSDLVKWIKDKHGYKNITAKQAVFKEYGKFVTYIHSVGPCYHCTNYHVTVAELLEFKNRIESTEEFRIKQRENEYKKKNRIERLARKKREKAERTERIRIQREERNSLVTN